MHRNMRDYYMTLTTQELSKRRSIKYVRLQKLCSANSWFDRRERESLEGTIKQIDVVLESRKLQLTLL